MQIHRFQFRMLERFSYPAVSAGRSVNAVIEPPNERVKHSLDVDSLHSFGESGEHHLPDISLTVAVGIFEIKNIRSGSHEEASPVAKHCRRPGKVIGKDRALIEYAVSVGIF